MRPKGRRNAYRRRRGRGFFLITIILLIIVSVLYGGSALVSRIGSSLGSHSEPLAELPVVGGGERGAVFRNQERVNILLLGTDRRPDEKGPTRTDTMLVVTLDPASKSAGMLSLPRDLWVRIPLAGGRWIEGKINTAHFYGDLYKYPGGGPALAKKTVENLLGIKINYVAKIDFSGFAQIVDTLGGINVDVERPLKDDAYPTSDYGVKRIFIPAGLQHFDGETALQYVRSRHQDSDFGRMHRQQQVLLAMREKALQLNIVPKLPKLISEFRDSLYTDLSPGEMVALAKLGKEVEAQNIVSRSIDECCVTTFYTTQGEEALLPNRAALQKAVQEVFSPPSTTSNLIEEQ
jgi:LCP family protein required for cell wall assembly